MVFMFTPHLVNSIQSQQYQCYRASIHPAHFVVAVGATESVLSVPRANHLASFDGIGRAQEAHKARVGQDIDPHCAQIRVENLTKRLVIRKPPALLRIAVAPVAEEKLAVSPNIFTDSVGRPIAAVRPDDDFSLRRNVA
jgi:hypothetical protein